MVNLYDKQRDHPDQTKSSKSAYYYWFKMFFTAGKEVASPFPHNQDSPLNKREIPSFSIRRAVFKETRIAYPKVKSIVPAEFGRVI